MALVVPFKAWHLDVIKPDPRLNDIECFTPKVRERLEKNPLNVTIMCEGKVVACVGVTEYHENRAEVWAVVDCESREHFVSVHKKTIKQIKAAPYKRFEYVADFDYAEAHRWARALGFKLEAPLMRKYGVDGRDYSLYSLVKE